jgi:hypothetical protein
MTEMHHYGDTYVAGELAERGTIHGSEAIDVQVDPVTGEVRAVWFRCRELPFRVSPGAPGQIATQPPIKVTAIEYLDT